MSLEHFKCDTIIRETSLKRQTSLLALAKSLSFCVPTGGSAVCAGDEQHTAAVCICSKRTGVDTGAQHHCQGAHGAAAAPAHKDQHPPNTTVL